MKTGIEIIAEERTRQINEEGYSAAHDSWHSPEELALAAVCYAFSEHLVPIGTNRMDNWPWDPITFKPTPDNRIRELAKAGALIAAAIDRRLQDEEGNNSEPQTT